jgi:hypothetical protein
MMTAPGKGWTSQKGDTNRKKHFKKRAVGYAEGGALISVGVHIPIGEE